MIETWYKQDIKKPVQVKYLDGNVFSADNNGNKVGVELFDGTSTANVSGSVSANIIRSDGQTVAVAGEASANKAWVVLPQSAYAIPGVISVIIKVTSGNDISTVCAVVANVYQSSTDTVIDPGTIIPSVQDLIELIETTVATIPADYSSLWTSLAPAFSTSTDYAAGKYVTYNGAVYRFNTNHAAGAWSTSEVTQVAICNEISDINSALTENVLSARARLSGTVTLSNYLNSGWYGIAGGTTITDKPNEATHEGGLTLFVYRSTNASGNYVYQILMQGNGVYWNRVLNKNTGEVVNDWIAQPTYHGNYTGTVTLSDLILPGWYSFKGNNTTFSDAPSGVSSTSGVTLIVIPYAHASGNFIIQFLVIGNADVYYRHIGTPSSEWVRYATQIDLANCIAHLGTISNSSTPLSEYRTPGWYGLTGPYNPADMPPGARINRGSTLFVFNKAAASSNYILQIFVEGMNFRAWTRTITTSGADITDYTWQEIGMARSVPIVGRTIEWYGDSTVRGQGGNGTSFPMIAETALSLIGTNLSVSGRSVSTVRSTPTPMVTAFETEITEKDVLYFQGGTNDFWSSAPMGTIDSFDTSTFYGALNTIISRLQTKFPSMCIILGTPFRIKYSQTGTYPLPETNSAGYKLTDYNDAIKAIGQKYCVPVMDNYNECGINPMNAAMFTEYMTDEVHMNANGYKKIGVYVTNKLREYFSHE